MKAAIVFILFLFSYGSCIAELIEGEAKVTEVNKKSWMFEMGPEIWGTGDYVIEIEYISPRVYEGQRSKLGVIDKQEITRRGQALREGDVLCFKAQRAVFEGELFPEVFSNLKEVRLCNQENHTVGLREAELRGDLRGVTTKNGERLFLPNIRDRMSGANDCTVRTVELFKWVAQGRIESYVVKGDPGFSTVFFYLDGGQRIRMNQSLSALNYMLVREVNEPKGIDFIENDIRLYYSTVMLSYGARILDKAYYEGYLWDLENGLGGSDVDQMDWFKEYCKGVEVTVKEDVWEMSFYCITESGGVEKHEVKGHLSPIRVDSILVTNVMEFGSLTPLMEF